MEVPREDSLAVTLDILIWTKSDFQLIKAIETKTKTSSVRWVFFA